MGKKLVGKNLWKLEVHVRGGGRFRSKKNEYFEGNDLQADMELIRIRLSLIDKKNNSKLSAKQRARKFKELLLYYHHTHPKLEKGKKCQMSVYNRLMLYLGEFPVEDVWGGLEAFVEKFTNLTCKTTYRKYAPATINRHISMAKATIRLAYFRRINNMRWIQENYLEGFKTLKENNIRYKIISGVEIKAINMHLPEHYKAIHYFASIVPIRVSELRQLKKEHLNLFQRIIQLPLSLCKNGFPRFVPIDKEMLPYFESLKNIPCDYLFHKFIKNKNKYCQVGDFRKAWKTACLKAGVNSKEYNFHKTRQQSAMGLLQQGFSTEEAMIIGGWKSRDAFERYCRVTEEMIKLRLGIGSKIDFSWKSEIAPGYQVDKSALQIAS